MPRAQRLVEKYKGKFEVVAVTVADDEYDLVVPYFTKHRYTFTPCRINMDIARAYGVRGAPLEFLIDTKGGAVLQLRLSSEERERRLGEIIEELLREPGK